SKKTSFGNVKVHSFGYSESKILFKLDYSLKKNVRCSLAEIGLSENKITAKCEISGSFTNMLAKIFNLFFAGSYKGVEFDFPVIKADPAKFDLPFKIDELVCEPDNVEVSGNITKKDITGNTDTN
ncbi:hypothetical protein ACFL7D_10510, partial [candidate division KSB1 bacterium]